MIVALCCQAYVKTYILTTYFFLNQRKLKLQELANKQEYKAKYMPMCDLSTMEMRKCQSCKPLLYTIDTLISSSQCSVLGAQRHVFAYKYSVLFTL